MDFYDLIPFPEAANKKGRVRIMLLHILFNGLSVIIGIAINAAMRAGVIHSNIGSQQAVALRTG